MFGGFAMSTPSVSINPPPKCVADALGLGSLADGEPGVDPALLRELYRHARGQNGDRILIENNPTFAKGWIDLASPGAVKLISVFVALDGDSPQELNRARRIAQSNLEAQAWNDVLDIDEPPIMCKVKIHGRRWALRFQSGGSRLKGRERVNEELPPIPGDETPGKEPKAKERETPPASTQGPKTAKPGAAEVLRKGGLPG
jgi:hypothetical protein